jgi:transketolase
MTITPSVSEKDLANTIRALAMDAVEKAKSGHPGMPMGMADVATVLFRSFLKFDAADPAWPDRDRFVLSAGHGSMLLYSLLYLTGYEGVTLDELKRFRQLGAKTAGHPEYGHCPGVETTTGPLGQGLATAVGMALAERIMNARFGDELVDHRTWVIAGDGCLMEGLSHEAIELAGHLKLDRLTVLWDDNSITIDGSTALSTSTNQLARFEAAGWDVTRVNGHDPEAIAAAMARVASVEKPSLIACKTVIGFGAPTKQGTEAAHGAPLGAAEIEGARKALGWPYAPFEIPADILSAWRASGQRGRPQREAWLQRLARHDAAAKTQFEAALKGDLTASSQEALAGLKRQWAEAQPKLATRQSSKAVLDVVVPQQPNLIGGSADLTHSNLTLAKGQKSITHAGYQGQYLHYGIREHGMAAAMNGLALHGGLIPYGGTFLIFTDYCRPSIRLSALMHQRVVYVMTHDSIGLGEDGPTHQPVEHVASLRAIPNTLVFRPADALETAEAWALALEQSSRPSILCLTRQAVPTLRSGPEAIENRSRSGAYLLREPSGERQVTLLATGSEVTIATAAAELLAQEGIAAAVVSMPSWELFREQSPEYRAKVLGRAPRVAVEAGIRLGWDAWLGERGAFVGMDGFGASAPAEALYQHFGITKEAVAAAARRLVAEALAHP